MLIINADDLGRTREETDSALTCHREGRITSATAMMFMDDSERAAELAREQSLTVGLHLNLSQQYHRPPSSRIATEAHNRIVKFMRSSKYAVLFYHPGLRNDFKTVFESQWNEFLRIFGKPPSHMDGHQHRHLCANVLFSDVIPPGQKVRKNFSFFPGQKTALNRFYRRYIDSRLARRYFVSDYFFGLPQCISSDMLGRVHELARSAKVELMTHPVKTDEFNFLMSDAWLKLLNGLEIGNYSSV
jgi:predicted glycoside hydrolase/deacetylase ChbG (UPF0249 family)